MEMTNEKDAVKLNRAISKALRGMRPPEDLTVSEWADKHRWLPRSASEPGPWRTSRTPYLKEPMDAFSDPKVHSIVMVASSQVGKSEFELNCIGYTIHQNPCNILYIHPDLDDARRFSRTRVGPMIKDSPVLRERVAKEKSRDSGNTALTKTYPGGMLFMVGTHVASDLASTPCRVVIGDEQDRWQLSAGNEGDPWKLATARQITFHDAKNVRVSTPTVKNASKIEKAYAEGTMERWCVQCPHCGGFHDIRFSDIRYTANERIVQKEKQYDITDIFYICPECGSISTEREIKRQPAKWIAENPDAYKRGVRSFWLNSFVSPWASWESSILEYQYALGDTKALQVVYNTRFGELWENRGDIEDEDTMLTRREDYPAELPEGVLVLTCGVDTQDNRLEYEVVGHGHFGETWGIQKGVIMGRPDEDKTWEMLDDVISHKYTYADGIGINISMTFIDEGGHFTMEVRQRAQARQARNVYCIKGMPGQDRPFTGPPKKMSIVVNQKVIGYCWQYQIGVDAGKQIIMDNLHVQEPGPKYCHFPLRDDYGPQFFTGLLSERLTYNEKKQKPWSWEKIPGHERNEPLDCRDYALAAFKSLPVNLDQVDRRLKAARGQRSAGTIHAPARRAQTAPKRRATYTDEW